MVLNKSSVCAASHMKPSEIAVKKDLDKFNCRVTIVFYVFLVVLNKSSVCAASHMKPSEIAVKKDLDKSNCRVTIVFYVFLVVLNKSSVCSSTSHRYVQSWTTQAQGPIAP